MRRIWLWVLLLLLATAAAFSPVLTAGFLNWDDEENVVYCPGIRGFAPSNLRWMLANFTVGDFKPLVCVSYAIDYSLWGLNPLGYHLPNLLLHCLNALLLFFLLRTLGRKSGLGAVFPAALFSALFFSLHPLRTEAVAWISDRKDLLCVFFYFLSLHAYLRFADSSGARWYWAALLCALLSSSSKAVAVSLPAVLLLLDWHPLNRLRGRWGKAIREKAPFLLIALAAAGIAFYGQMDKKALAGLAELGIADRLLLVFRTTAFYLGKTVLPAKLSGAYSPLEKTPANLPRLLPSALALSAFVLALARPGRGRDRLPALGLGWFLLSLLPVSGLLKTGVVSQADRFSYLPAAGLSLILLPAFSAVYGRFRTAAILAAAAGCYCLGLFSWYGTLAWRDAESLWASAAKNTPDSAAARTHYGQVLYSAGRMGEAAANLTEALRLMDVQGVGADGMRFAATSNLGRALKNLGRLEEAAAIFTGLLASGDEWVIHHSLAGTYQALGKQDLAESEYRAVLGKKPDFVPALCDLGLLLAQRRRTEEALALYQRALRISPGSPRARYNLALALLDRGESARGIESLEQLGREYPASPLVARALIVAYAASGEEAKSRELGARWPSERPPGDSYLPYTLQERPGLMAPIYLNEK